MTVHIQAARTIRPTIPTELNTNRVFGTALMVRATSFNTSCKPQTVNN